MPARLVGQDAYTGSIKPGKKADLVLIDGDPTTRIGALRQTRLVMLDGKLLMPMRYARRRALPDAPSGEGPARCRQRNGSRSDYTGALIGAGTRASARRDCRRR
ncbi:MAG: amidohydrolase family protein [Pseudomonadota bacterium]|nr:amidohydrolase family protein [Pseudomonadota bacterium]